MIANNETSGRKRRKRMWFSFDTASAVYDWANIFLIGALAVGVVATVLVVWMGHIKEEYLRRDIVSSKTESANAHERAAKAEQAAAEANRIAEGERLARVKIEEKLAPRGFSNDQLRTIASNMSKWAKLPGTETKQSAAVFSVSSSFESSSLADQIAAALKAAGWDINRFPVTYGKSYSISGVGILTSSNPRGVSVGDALSITLNSERMFAFIIPEKRSGCEEQKMEASKIETNPWCSSISVFVGDHP